MLVQFVIMQELELPYIGVKIESLPTILSLLKASNTDEDFISFYTTLGKSRKTATEYLASLRNLRLAAKDKKGHTRLVSAGENILEDNVDRLYENLMKHCLKEFQDFRLIQKIWNKAKSDNLADFAKSLEIEGLTIRRRQTLSSFFKILREGKERTSRRLFISFNYLNEPLEYNQFVKALQRYNTSKLKPKTTLKEFYYWLGDHFSITREKFDTYLKLAKNDNLIKLTEVNARVLENIDDAFVLNNKYYYFIELT